ncbi:MAG: hypothetical protein WBF64_02355 [Xanthobacteraceae bacterium]
MAEENIHPIDHDAALRATLPTPVKEQPDPFLQMSTGKTSVGGITLFALAAVVILAVVLYGLNAPSDIASTSAPTSSVAQSGAPAAGGHGSPAAPTAPQTTNNAKG